MSTKLLFPDPLSSTSQLSGSCFLYFHESPISLTLQPSVSMPLTGCNPFSFLPYIEARNPPWKKAFLQVFGLWNSHHQHLNIMNETIKPLRGLGFESTHLIYSKTEEALNHSKEILKATGLTSKEVYTHLNLEAAADELMAHIFFEKFLELYFPSNFAPTAEYIAAMHKNGFQEKKVDFRPLFEYCSGLFTSYELHDLLVLSYLFRFRITFSDIDILLSNRNIQFLISKINIEDSEQSDPGDPKDLIAWEIFKNILSPFSDGIDRVCISNIKSALKNRRIEISNLKSTCQDFAMSIPEQNDPVKLQREISIFLRTKVQKDINAVLRLRKDKFQDYMSNILADEKCWLGVGTTIASFFLGQELISVGAAVAGTSFLGAKLVGDINERRNVLKSSPYALLYYMR